MTVPTGPKIDIDTIDSATFVKADSANRKAPFDMTTASWLQTTYKTDIEQYA